MKEEFLSIFSPCFSPEILKQQLKLTLEANEMLGDIVDDYIFLSFEKILFKDLLNIDTFYEEPVDMYIANSSGNVSNLKKILLQNKDIYFSVVFENCEIYGDISDIFNLPLENKYSLAFANCTFKVKDNIIKVKNDDYSKSSLNRLTIHEIKDTIFDISSFKFLSSVTYLFFTDIILDKSVREQTIKLEMENLDSLILTLASESPMPNHLILSTDKLTSLYSNIAIPEDNLRALNWLSSLKLYSKNQIISKGIFENMPGLKYLKLKNFNLNEFKYNWIKNLPLKRVEVNLKYIWREYFSFRKKGYRIFRI